METPARDGPLNDIRVLDVATFIAGPFCATLLAEFGADVIKVEMPGRGDPMRQMGQKHNGVGLTWAQEARNRRGITCDLRRPEGQRLVRELAKQCDVLVENFRPGTMERWNLGYDALSEVNPRLVMVRVSGYGQTGPYSEKPGFGRVAQAYGGLTYLSGFPDQPPVTPGSPTIADYLAGLYGAYSTLVALEHRRSSGKGQVIDISLFEGVFRILDNLTIAYQKLGLVRERSGTATANVVPHNHYPTRDGRWVAIACTTDRIFERLAEAMGRVARWAATPATAPAPPASRTVTRSTRPCPGGRARSTWTTWCGSSTSARCRSARSTASPTSSGTRTSSPGAR